MNATAFIIENVTVYAEQETIQNGYIKVENGEIKAIGRGDIRAENHEVVYPTSENLSLLPGMIDVHIHGVNGADTMDATPEALDVMTEALPREGTTSFLATTITQDAHLLEKAIKNAGDYIHGNHRRGRAEVLGIHLEGPFLNAERAGAQPPHAILEPNIKLFKEWNELAQGTIKLVTLAPEKDGGVELVRYLSEQDIVASIGHSDATYAEVVEAVEYGATHVTHLFNGMRGLHHREPGVAGAALLSKDLKAEIIADGHHVRPEMIHLAYKQKSGEGIILITDAMRAKCLKNGRYELGGQDVWVQDGKALLKNGTLAGSVLSMNDALRNIQDFTGCTLESAIKMAAENPAKQLGVYDRKGSIAAGKDADFILLNDDGDVVMTFCKGQLAYTK
ncbi:N-acetylglucosamine-6-phosphate deacetylase [Pseudalkalibacillus hwajinpoensis]|uniref:N-acetylglucosamine-6-phosphate deacetylase n=1 Tax=Guptibacillus hwajinpoensis TaxID=208199 RepID=A0A4U1MB32_9BACL|nr:N-acetylglucosamine-6-phosphate deacetylase [Pseudalkalibacillus hwajinpoensis]TKD67701.1 N-acetylglucosamine-6-phosphate deacetylase [Pseudalkalibacillus hwajinpoensis]